MVRLNNVTYSCSNKIIINNINIVIEDNKVLGISGKSGSGKTTLLELINGLIKPNKGNIYINNKSIDKINKKDIGFVFQMPEEQFFEINVKKEIEFALKNFKIKGNINNTLDLVGLDESFLSRKTKSLSYGEKRLVAFASILIYDPKIILFDEPTIGLDNNNKKKFIELIKKLKENNKTIIIVSHDVDLLYQLSDNILIIDKGRLISYSDKESVYDNIDVLKEKNISIPKIILFEKLAKQKKNIKLMHSNCINDLIKEVYRNV